MTSSSRKRSASVALGESLEIEELNDEQPQVKSLKISLDRLYNTNAAKIKPKAQEIAKFEVMFAERRQECVKSVTRLFIFKGKHRLLKPTCRSLFLCRKPIRHKATTYQSC